MNTAIITPSEADTFLAQYSIWDDLPTLDKTFYIYRASVYVQTHWVCVDEVVWETSDDETINIPDEIKEAVAYFAYADSQSNLFGDVTTEDEKRGTLKALELEASDLRKRVEYYSGSSYPGALFALGYPSSLMSVYCKKGGVNSTELVRV